MKSRYYFIVMLVLLELEYANQVNTRFLFSKYLKNLTRNQILMTILPTRVLKIPTQVTMI
jgi:hypothetical protein